MPLLVGQSGEEAHDAGCAVRLLRKPDGFVGVEVRGQKPALAAGAIDDFVPHGGWGILSRSPGVGGKFEPAASSRVRGMSLRSPSARDIIRARGGFFGPGTADARGMKKVTADFIRQEVTRFGALVAQTPIFHPCGLRLHSAGDVLGLAHAKAFRESFIDELALADFREDPRKALGIQQVPRHQVSAGDVLADDLRNSRNEILLPAGTTMDADNLGRLQDISLLAIPIRHRQLSSLAERAQPYLSPCPAPEPRPKAPPTR